MELSMNSGQYHHRREVHGLPLEFQFDGDSVLSSQPTHYQMQPSDGLPRVQPDQQLLNTLLPSFYSYNLSAAMPHPNVPTEWTVPSQTPSTFENQAPIRFYDYYPSNPNTTQDRSPLQGQFTAEVPRSWPEYDASLLSDNSLASKMYKPSAYMLDSPREEPKSFGLPYAHQYGSGDFSRVSISPKIENDVFDNEQFSFNNPPPRMPTSESSDDSVPSSREMTAVEVEDHGVDEPYAKLIYRALMSAPDHAMALQEIYQWFRENTIKGSSDTKGWMNSIRHNLSMNAAFKKTERKLSGDETKKSTEWVLEDFAIKDGVQSTTRYRKGTSSKKFARSNNPAPSRQRSGQIGGIKASRITSRRQRVKDDSRQNNTRMDTGKRLEFNYDGTTPQTMQRHISPPTPTAESSFLSSYVAPKDEQFEMHYEEMYGMGDVQGVFIDDTPLFSNNHNCLSQNKHSIMQSARMPFDC